MSDPGAPHAPKRPSPLADFIEANLEPLLADWETFARKIPSAREFDVERLRDDAGEMLHAVAADLRTPQTSDEQFAKSEGRAPAASADSAADAHGADRYAGGFDLNELVMEYRALRATVIRQWQAQAPASESRALDDVVRFSEAIDQALTESVRRFTRDRDRDRQRLRDEEERLAIAVDAAELAVWEVDLASGRWSTRSPRHDLLFGYADAQPEWSHAHAERHVLEEDRPELRAAFARAAQVGTLAAEVRVRRHDGDVRWISLRGRTRCDDAGRPAALSGIVEDVSERRQFETALRDADRRKDEFLAVLAHELRNPLAPLSSGLQILARHARSRPDAIDQQLPRMQRQLALLVRLVDDLLDVSRISRGAIALQREPVSLPSIVRQAVEATVPLIERREHRLTVQVESEGIYVHGDRTRLVQVFANLLGNAAKYIGDRGEIEVAVHCDEGCATVCVADDGPGIPPDVRPRAFEMFAQGAAEPSKPRDGLGIGLWLVRRLVELHGGTVELLDDPRPGTRFLVRLERVRRADDGTAVASAEAANRDLHALRVLVVDDNGDAADALSEWLRTLGHDVRTVHDGGAALDCAAAFQPAVVLMDIGMPGLDGYEVARRLRSRPEGRSALLVAVSGWGQENDLDRARAAGFDHHLVKPADPALLQRILRSH